MALWTPSEITTTAWYDADDAATITESVGDVSQWDDKSGNDYHLTQATSLNQPLTGSAKIGTLNTISFDGVDHYMNSSPPRNATESMFCVVETSDRSLGIFVFTTSGNRQYKYSFGGTDFIIYNGTVGPRVTNGLTNNVPALVTAILNGASSYVDIDGGTKTASGDPGSSTVSGLSVGSGGNRAVFDIGELVLIGSVADSDTVDKIEGYLAHKWGLEGNLPGGHPYKSEAPTVGDSSVSVEDFIYKNLDDYIGGYTEEHINE